jgi:hypothetical protein
MLLGKPGTVIEVCGTIHVDFKEEKNEASHHSMSNMFNQNGTSGISLKRTEVAMISEVQIIFNRSKAAEQALEANIHAKSTTAVINATKQ